MNNEKCSWDLEHIKKDAILFGTLTKWDICYKYLKLFVYFWFSNLQNEKHQII